MYKILLQSLNILKSKNEKLKKENKILISTIEYLRGYIKALNDKD